VLNEKKMRQVNFSNTPSGRFFLRKVDFSHAPSWIKK
jgi:hypothetical protein